MRNVGAGTLAAIQNQIFQTAIRVIVIDEAGTEYTVPDSAVIGDPRFSTDLDQITWRLSLTILQSFPTSITCTVSGVQETTPIIAKGRNIKVLCSFAPGEEFSELTGYMAEVTASEDWSEGFKRDAWVVECYGALAKIWEGHIKRLRWDAGHRHPDTRPGYTPSVGQAFRLTGIARMYRMTNTYTHDSATATTTSAITGSPATFTVNAIPSGWAAGKVAWIYNAANHYCERIKISAINGLTITVDNSTPLSNYSKLPVGSVLRASGATVLLANSFFPDSSLENWVTLKKADGTPITNGYVVAIDFDSECPVIFFANDPGVTYTVEIRAVERWVIVDRRWYHDGNTVQPGVRYYYTLAGVAGDAGAEQLNEPAYSTLKTDKTNTASEVWAVDPSGYFASETNEPRYISVWDATGKEYRGKVLTVEKTPGDTYGKITMAINLRALDGASPTLTGGETIANTTTTYYEILDGGNRATISDSAGNDWGGFLRFEPNGGFFVMAYKAPGLMTIIPNLDPAVPFQFLASGDFIVVAPAAGTFPPENANATNDVANFIKTTLAATGFSSSLLTGIESTGYTLAPAAWANKTIGEIIDEVRRATVPPNYRLWEQEDGSVVGRYITQKSVPDLVIRNLRSLEPTSPAHAFTRVIVKGKQHEINRAGQYLAKTPEGLDQAQYMFDLSSAKARSATGSYAHLTARTAKVVFAIPNVESGRWPGIARVVIEQTPMLLANLGGASTVDGNPLWIAPGLEPNDTEQDFIKREYSGDQLAMVANGSGVTFLTVELQYTQPGDPTAFDDLDGVSEIELYMLEGAYFEAKFTSDTNLAPADGGGPAVFGRSWNQPDRTIRRAYRYAPPGWLKRNQANGIDLVITIEADGITQDQAREIGIAAMNLQLLGSEFYKAIAPYDPRAQKGDTAEVWHYDSLLNIWTTKDLLVWGITKGGQDMELQLANYNQ